MVRSQRTIRDGVGLGVAAALLALCGLLGWPRPAAGEPTFALVPPDAVTALRLTSEAPEARAAIRAASAAARREPNALARVHTEGTLPHQGIYDQSREAMRDWTAMRDLGLGFALSQNETYLRAAERYFTPGWTCTMPA